MLGSTTLREAQDGIATDGKENHVGAWVRSFREASQFLGEQCGVRGTSPPSKSQRMQRPSQMLRSANHGVRGTLPLVLYCNGPIPRFCISSVSCGHTINVQVIVKERYPSIDQS